MSNKSALSGPPGVVIGTAASGVIATVEAGASVKLSAGGLCCRPILHRGDGWRWLSEEDSKQDFIDGGVVVQTRFFDDALRVVAHAEQVGERSVVVLEAHNDGDTPFGFGWALSGLATEAGLVTPIERSIAIDASKMTAPDDCAVRSVGRGEVELAGLEDPSTVTVSSRRPKPCWGVLAGPLTHGMSARIFIDGIDEPEPVVCGADTVRNGWAAYSSLNAATIVLDNQTIASLYRSAVTRVALSNPEDPIDAALVAAVEGSLSASWPNETGVSRKALRDPTTARRLLFVASRWVRDADRDRPDWSESATACLALGATALETLERHEEPIDAASASWLALLASELDQSADTVRSIATAGSKAFSRPSDDSDLCSTLLSGWDDRLVERLDRVRVRYGRLPEGFIGDTARPLGRFDHDATAAAFVAMIESMLCTQWPGDVVEILPTMPQGWIKTPVEVSGVELSMGRLSFAVRWHDDRPALLWELDRSAGTVDSLHVRCGLDVTFEGHGDRGEALLS